MHTPAGSPSNRLISGAPKVPGTYTVTVSATNTVGTATKSLSLTVQHP